MKTESEHYNKFLKFIWDPEIGCHEFVCWKATISKAGMIEKTEKFPRTLGGWFIKQSALKFEVERLKGCNGYLGLNPVSHDLLARSKNEITTIKKGSGTKEENIVTFRHFLIDIDVKRPVDGISATDEELSKTIVIRDNILNDYPTILDNSIWGCSGNGAYIVVKMHDMKIRSGKDYVKSTLRFLADRYGKKSNSLAYIDTNTYSPTFHLGIPGTYKCKGSSTEERPHRLITVDGVGWIVDTGMDSPAKS